MRRVDSAGADADAVADIIRRLAKVLRALPEHKVESAAAEVVSYLQHQGLPQASKHACTHRVLACLYIYAHAGHALVQLP